jgi:hypothetical protein
MVPQETLTGDSRRNQVNRGSVALPLVRAE